MVTTVGTESTIEDLLNDLIELDYDAADAYQAAIDRLDDPAFRTTLSEFKRDHLRHIDELGLVLTGLGRTPPKQGNLKILLTRGKVIIGGLAGDKAILQAMRTNEADTNTAYERAVQFRDLTSNARDVLDRGLEDERRHCEWILSTLKTL
ncbi:MAG TPA: ferritin-like domain-containing protein [Stellaceae bacterium]|nr:ferritin-like domain-containing protein [Stellaceae bacterium]